MLPDAFGFRPRRALGLTSSGVILTGTGADASPGITDSTLPSALNLISLFPISLRPMKAMDKNLFYFFLLDAPLTTSRSFSAGGTVMVTVTAVGESSDFALVS